MKQGRKVSAIAVGLALSGLTFYLLRMHSMLTKKQPTLNELQSPVLVSNVQIWKALHLFNQ